MDNRLNHSGLHLAGLVFGLLLLSVPITYAATDSSSDPTDMPVKKVVLYRSGVGYFEHGGTVQGNRTTELRFKSAQINDILKSLVLEDLDGGKIGTISYPSQDPITKTLQGFQVDIASNPSLAELLNQLRGTRIRITVHTEQMDGIILGVEKRNKILPEHEGPVVEEWMLNLLAGEVLRSIALDKAQKIEIQDAVLEQELHKALSVLAEDRNQDKKPVIIHFQGAGNRRVRLRYVIETPIWKSSYRLILPPKTGRDAKLQGWAIVENQTDTDWNDIQLSLVSGRPISFIEDLYTPIYLERPVVQPELYTSLRPQRDEGGIASVPLAAGKEMRSLKMAAIDVPHAIAMPLEAYREDNGAVMEAFDPTRSIVSAASAAKLGELFQYTVGRASLSRNRSAMFPILTENVEAERVSIFNVEVMPRNPLRGVFLRNATDKHVMQGPVTVFEGNTYAGDAQIGNLPPGQERLLSYALDLEVSVDATQNRQESRIQTASIVKGVLHVSRKNVFSQDYTIQNKSDAERVVILEHRYRPGWKWVTPAPMETTETHARLKQTVSSGKAETMMIVEEQVYGETIALLPTEINQLEFYNQSGQIPKAVREKLETVIALKRAMADSQSQIQEKRVALESLSKEQNRIRSNMKTVDSGSAYYVRLLEKLNTQETTIEGIQAELHALEKKLDGQRQALTSDLEKLSVP